MALLLAAGLAWAHGGEDHGVAQATAVTSIDAVEVAAASSEFEAVLRVPRGGGPVTAWIADADSSRPVAGGSASLSLSCGGEAVQIELDATDSPGTWSSVDEVPGKTCEGALAVTADGRSDLLEVPPVELAITVQAAAAPVRWAFGLGLLCAIAAASIIAFGAGWLGGRRRRAATAILAALLVAGATRTWAHGGEDHGGGGTPPPSVGGALRLPMASQFLLELRTERVTRTAFVDRVEAYGALAATPGAGAELRAQVGGQVEMPAEGAVLPGRQVAAGAVLAWLTEQPGAADRMGLAGGQAELGVRLAEARAALVLAERDAARAEALVGVISDRERTARAEAVIVAREAVARLEEAARSSGSGRVAVRAPMSGRVAWVGARPGDTVTAGDPLFRIVAEGALQALARLPEALGGDIVAGADARVAPAAFPDRWWEATVIDPGQVVDPATGMLPLTLQLALADSSLKPGMSVRAVVARGAAREAVVVPDAAIVDSGGQPLVFVKTGPETFEVRLVRVGGLDAGAREVRAGLAPGERVVVAGTYALRSLAGR